ncbi:fumarylacetoacetate hydrolase family protein [Cnuibacter sp. UC19_7]|uniref:fumarylacetoacetate hydrolase family protein n=1 Tax=Cnuibacter sp. UC19_7 TaxID=3350166 RepID=UPI00366A5C2E
MKLARIGAEGAERPVVVTADGYRDLTTLTDDITGEFLAGGGVDRVRAALEDGSLPLLSDDGQRVGAPIARPSAIICIGMNYAAHAAESGSAPPTVPILFLKTPNTIAGPFDAARIPRKSTKTDWEVELAVVIGSRASYLESPAQAIEHIAGFTIANDLSEREWQLEISGGQWSKGKSAPGFTPLGPWLVTPDEVGYQDLRLASRVNGDPRQDSRTSDLIFGVDELIYQLSQWMTLEPGDLVLTGTPEGVALSGRFPYLKAGDVVELEIEGLGTQRQEFVDA